METKMKPSDFKSYPFSSVLQNSESETVALNIMVILSRTGDVFRDLTWEEYKLERMKDGNFTETEIRYFKLVIDYCKSSGAAIIFSSNW